MSESDISDIRSIEINNNCILKGGHFYELQPRYSKGQI